MATTWTVSNKRDAQVAIHPPVVLAANGASAGKNSYSGIFRAVRCTLTAAGTYTTGGDVPVWQTIVGLKQVDAILIVTDTSQASTPAAQLVYNTVTGKLQLFTGAGVETAAAAGTNGTFEVIILGR